MFINRRSRELNLKIVYYGPAMSGKTTNLLQIHKRANPNLRGDLVSLKTNEDRTIFFDYMQMELGKVGGFTPKFHLYTVPGQVYYAASRKLVLRGADGVVFVADSQISRTLDNLTSWDNLQEHLQELSLTSIPLVVQFNKRDLPGVGPIHLLRQVMRLNGLSVYEASAINGDGVFDTLKAVIGKVTAQIHRQMAAKQP